MDVFKVEGNGPLEGEIKISGSKNSALPIFAACLLTKEPVHLKNIPNLSDIRYMIEILEYLGAKIENPEVGEWIIHANTISHIAPYELVRKMRASVCLLGPLVARLKKAEVSIPGGCVIGREAPYDNQDLVTQILKLRHTYAQIIGKESFAEYTTNRRMVKNGHSASSFIESMHKQIKSAFDKECTLLKDYKASKTDQAESALEPWDIGYWSEQHQKEYYQFDEEALRPYFPIEKVINGLFSICEKLFHLSIEPIEAIHIVPKAGQEKEKLNPKQLPEVWHPDVKLYNLYEKQTHTLLGSFYADWHPRESKRSGAWMNYLRTGTRTETHTPHLGLICGNLTPPLKDTPSLLTHHEVETIFHEFGHLLHHLCGTVEVPSLNGVNVAWDFVELPSQIMENWCWERESLDLFARHYETDEPIPQDLFEKMQACKNHFKAMGTMRQLSLAKLDLDLHRDWVLDSSQVIDNYLKQRLKDYHFTFSTPTRPIICNFGHLFSSTTGYAAGYYSYKWAEVLDADAFTRFQKEGLLNPETGLAFRNTILANGNSKDPYQLFQDFMGRKPKTDALLKRDGIIA